MSKTTALDKIDKELGIYPGSGSVDYEALKRAMNNWFDVSDLEEFADFLENENS